MTRPNIVYLHSHDTGRYIQPYGYAIPTPNMQRLAEQGVTFRQAFCAGPTCSPSRAALLTGRSPHSCGMMGLAHRGWSLSEPSQHIVHLLRQAGYESVLAGAQHVSTDPQTIGYDRLLNADRKLDADLAARQYLDSRPQQPFFLDVGFQETHRTGSATLAGFNGAKSPVGDPRYVRPPAPLPDTPEVRQDMADFAVAAARLDQAYGVVLDALEQNGLAENTIVICTTDHGIAFPGMKCNLTDHGLGILLLMRGPGGLTGGKVIDGMVSNIDVLPTLCELIGIDVPPGVEGKSFMPLVRSETDQIHETIFGEVTYHAHYEPKRAARTTRWKYTRRFEDWDTLRLVNCDNSPSKQLWLQAGWEQRPIPGEALYDLMFDPHEANNLACDPGHQQILSEMRQRLESWMQQTNDPLLVGPVALPPGGYTGDKQM